MYSRYTKIRDAKGLKDADVARGSGLPAYVFSDWKRGKSIPKADKLKKIADFLDVSIDYLLTGEEPRNEYFLDPYMKQAVQDLHDKHGVRIVFDASRKAKQEDLEWLIETLRKMGMLDD